MVALDLNPGLTLEQCHTYSLKCPTTAKNSPFAVFLRYPQQQWFNYIKEKRTYINLFPNDKSITINKS